MKVNTSPENIFEHDIVLVEDLDEVPQPSTSSGSQSLSFFGIGIQRSDSATSTISDGNPVELNTSSGGPTSDLSITAANHEDITEHPEDDSYLENPVFSDSSKSHTAIDEIVKEASEYCRRKGLDNNPVEILRYYQTQIVQGRRLEVEDITVTDDGETNQIFVDRNNILATGMDEIKLIANKRLTLEVQFYGEVR